MIFSRRRVAGFSWHFDQDLLRLESIKRQEAILLTLNPLGQNHSGKNLNISSIHFQFVLFGHWSGYNLPRFWEVSYSARDATNYTDLVPTTLRSPMTKVLNPIDRSRFRQNKKYIEIYVTWLYLVFMYILPFLLLTILNGMIYAEVSS